MKLFIVESRDDRDVENNPWDPWWNTAVQFVIRAENEQEARALASKNGGKEIRVDRETGKVLDPWLDPAYTSCEELLPEGVSKVIVRDMRDA